MATVVLPVPGWPVKDICRVGRSVDSSIFSRNRATSSKEAISRIRALTGLRPTSSLSNSARTSSILESRWAAATSTRPFSASRVNPGSIAEPTFGPSMTASKRRLRLTDDDASVLGCSAVPRLAFRVGTNRVLDLAVPLLRPLHVKTGLVFGALHDEAQHGGLPALGSVVAVHLDVEVGECRTARIDFSHDIVGIREIEHGQSPHLPVHVSRMGVVGILDRQSPAIDKAISHLAFDFVVSEIGQIGKRPLSDSHRWCPFTRLPKTGVAPVLAAALPKSSRVLRSDRESGDRVRHIRRLEVIGNVLPHFQRLAQLG